ncbi:phosphatase [Nocardia sp. NPDC051570]|uniref:phosphatase n=1 Tax=Nocardia sp. NPDC051570 TaxID=3364324 RepID=UPI0037A15999
MPTLADYLAANAIAGEVATPRESNLANIAGMLDDGLDDSFGLTRAPHWTVPSVLEVMVEKVGVNADIRYTTGQDTIDPMLTVAALGRLGDRLGRAVQRRERVLFATGHPVGLLAMHIDLAAALKARGCEVLRIGAGLGYVRADGMRRDIRYLAGVAMSACDGNLEHTHRPDLMSLLLKADVPRPDLVVADHGWAGAAAEAGLPVVGFADCNDPALFVAEAEGRIEVVVPLDDSVAPHLYTPLADYVLNGAEIRS